MPSASWSSSTWRPSLSELSEIVCSVVVAGSLPVAATAVPPLGEARGRADGERRERAEREPFGARAGGHEPQLGGTAAGARAAERELPWLARRRGRGDRGRLARAASPSRTGRGRGGCRQARGAASALRRPARARVRGERESVPARRPRGRRQQDHVRIPTCEASFLTLLGAYGVSCRARVTFYATPHLVAIRPRSRSAALGPPILHPVGSRTRHERAAN